MYYVCVLSTDDYLQGVLILNENLKALNSKYKLLCIINENICLNAIKILDYFNIKHKFIPSISYTSNCYNRWNYTFDKINVFSLTEYKKIIYLDSDLLILKNLDHLFNLDQQTMVSDKPFTKGYNSALMVIKPSKKDYHGLLNIIKKYSKENKDLVGDQNVINEYFKNKKINKLNSSYNQMKGIIEQHRIISINDISPPVKYPKVIHYIYQPKLFMIYDKKIDIDDYTKIYYNYLKTIRNKMKNINK